MDDPCVCLQGQRTLSRLSSENKALLQLQARRFMAKLSFAWVLLEQ